MDKVFDEFKNYLIDKKAVSTNTLQSYLRDIKTFNHYCLVSKFEKFSNINVEDLKNYVSYLEEQGKSSATITRNIASIRCFYQFLILDGKATLNPAKSIKRKKEDKKAPEFLSEKEIELLLSQPDDMLPKGCRDKAMLELLYATGIKVSELINLDLNDINIKSGILICKNSRNVRVIPVYKVALDCVAEYINKVRKSILAQNDSDTQSLFVNLNGNRLTRQGFWKIIKHYAASAKIDKDITPITLRHSFALHLLENGAALTDIKDMLGHADISSTQIYADVLSQRIKNVYNKYHPMALAKE